MKNYLFFLLLLFIISCKQQKTEIKTNKNIHEVIDNKDSIFANASDTLNNISDYKCNINLVANLQEKMENANETDIESFLLTFDSSCKNNVEYSQFSNEVLFNLLRVKAITALKIMSANNSINNEIIFEKLESPINDGINIIELIKIIEPIDSNVTNEVLDALNVALNKY